MPLTVYEINDDIMDLHTSDKSLISDGSHTFGELYHHRMILFATLCNMHPDASWKSRCHDDGSMFEDYFICGIETPAGQFTYHYHLDDWHWFKIKEVDYAPSWDGHTSKDVVRLLML